MARVRGVIAGATAAGSRLKVPGSTSTKRGVPPALWIAPAVAKNVKGLVLTSSRGSSRSALSASSSASVRLAPARAWGTRQGGAAAVSNCATAGPMTNCCDAMTACRAGSTSSRMARYCATRSNSGTFTWSVSFEGATIYPGRRGGAIGRSAPFVSAYVAPQAAHSLRPPATARRSPHWHIHPTRRAGTPSIRPKAGTSAVTTAPADHAAGQDVTEVPDLCARADPRALVDVARLVDEVVGH